MSSSSPLSTSFFEVTLESLMGGETSVAAFTSIKGGLSRDEAVNARIATVLKQSQERFVRLREEAESYGFRLDPTFDPRLNTVLDRAFARFGKGTPAAIVSEGIFSGVREIRLYQERVLTDFRAELCDLQDQELRNWSTEEIMRLRCEIATLEEPSPVLLAEAS